MAHLKYVSFGPVYEQDGQLTSDIASSRYRILLPAQHLSRRHRIEILQPPTPETVWPDAIVNDTQPDGLIFSKSRHLDNERLAQAYRQRGQRVVLDICDNYFDHQFLGDQWQQHILTMCNLASDIIASTPKMAELIAQYTGKQAHIISDPVEGSQQPPRFAPQFPRVRLLWFGHQGNWNSLEHIFDELLQLTATLPLMLTIITAPLPAIVQRIDQFNQQHQHALPLTLIPWSLHNTWQALHACDVVILPSLPSAFNNVKSPNRLSEALWAGRFVIAHPLPAYQDYAPFVWLGKSIAAGIKYAIDNPTRVQQQIQAGQQFVAQQQTSFHIAAQWEQALALNTSAPLKLNLGCGDKILPDYINVDVVTSRQGKTPDVLCDLHHLNAFADNSVDEILAVHVIEHFWRWEVRDILVEWLRVLKPGGKMILECPNLTSACQHFLQNPDLHAQADQRGQRSMWVFYGDPAWQDPYMIHRWGYTPNSLAQLMTEAGLTQLQQEPAQFKLREPRDMRITGIKPHTAFNAP